MDIENIINKELEFKTCKTCNTSKELKNFRRYYSSCRKCNMEKQADNHLKNNKIYYLKHQEKLQKQTLENYYKRKYNNSLLLTEANQQNIICN